jgi:hypothetical protein
MENKSSIFDGTPFAEVENYKGDLMPINEKIPKLTNQKEISVMNDLEKTLYTLYYLKIGCFDEIVEEVLGKNYMEIPDYSEVFWAKINDEQLIKYDLLSKEAEFFWETMWDLIFFRIPEDEEKDDDLFRVFLFPDYKIVSGIQLEVSVKDTPLMIFVKANLKNSDN